MRCGALKGAGRKILRLLIKWNDCGGRYWNQVIKSRPHSPHGVKTQDSRIFGDNRFVDNVLAEAEPLPERKPDVNAVVAAVKKIYGLSDEHLRSRGRQRESCEARGLAAWATLEISSGKLTELAKLLGRDSSTLTCAVRRIEKRREEDPSLVDKMERLRREILESSYQVLTL